MDMFYGRRQTSILISLTGVYTVLFIIGYSIWTMTDNSRVTRHRGHYIIQQTNNTVSTLIVERNVRVLCWIMTSPRNVHMRAVHIQMTWGQRCDKTLYISSRKDKQFQVVSVNVREGRRHLTEKSHKAFRYIYKHYMNEYDWFLKADDDTYVIVENLRHFLSKKDRESPIYFGQKFNAVIEGGYASGGAGYVLSREALKRLATDGQKPENCRQDGGAEDVEIGLCLHNLGVELGTSYDDDGKSLFHCFNPAHHILGMFPKWYGNFSENGNTKGQWTMSKHVITFHYVTPELMYVLDFFLYHAAVKDSSERVHTAVRDSSERVNAALETVLNVFIDSK